MHPCICLCLGTCKINKFRKAKAINLGQMEYTCIMYYTDAISQYEYPYSLHQFYSLVTGLRERSDSVSRRFRSRLRRSSQIPAREDRRHTFPVSDFQEIDGSGRSAFLPTLSFGCVCVVVCGERTLTANAVRRSHRKRAQ